jgi:DNA-binding transcriptional ArsR family regulator
MASKIGGTAALEHDTVLRTLSKPERRSVLKQVCDHAGPITVDDLAAAIAAAEFDASVGDERSVLRSLRHIHLLKLADVGLIEYDRTSETATVTETGTVVLASFERSARSSGWF